MSKDSHKHENTTSNSFETISNDNYLFFKSIFDKHRHNNSKVITEKEYYCLLSYLRASQLVSLDKTVDYWKIELPYREKHDVDSKYTYHIIENRRYFMLHTKYNPFPKSLTKKFNSLQILIEDCDNYNFYTDYLVDVNGLLTLMTLGQIKLITSQYGDDNDIAHYKTIFNQENDVRDIGKNSDLEQRVYLLYEEKANNRSSKQYQSFEKTVLERDGYECQICGSKVNPCVHHILPYRTHKSLRTDVNNGITLCEMHHSSMILGGFHQVYGTYNNTKEQLQEYCDAKRKELGLEPKII